MQTFLPYSDFTASARVLDYRRLGKQRVETFQLLNAIRGVDKYGEPKEHKGWVNHPAAVMWRGYVPALALYGVAMCDEWIRRGYNDSLRPKLRDIFLAEDDGGSTRNPWWLGDREFHRSHQSNLLRKDFEYYSEIFGDVPTDLPYVWPGELPTSNRIELPSDRVRV